MRVGVYAGSFDPMTNGHMWMVRKGAALFDRLIVAVGTNPDKRWVYSVADRVRLLKACTESFPNVAVTSFQNRYLVDFAREVGAQYILRGIRNEGDYAYERGMRYINADLAPEVTTVFLMPPREMAEISSSFVRGLIGPEGWEQVVCQYVPEPVLQFLLSQTRSMPAASH
ncbi:MAG: pantetheine-phosphate adenylyltransferase [Limnochordaceae bacterium]|nr:pantetheine-phosphate adenylyltransferase [Limnochordaceae bacterium]